MAAAFCFSFSLKHLLTLCEKANSSPIRAPQTLSLISRQEDQLNETARSCCLAAVCGGLLC